MMWYASLPFQQTLTHVSYVSLVSSQMETVSKMCLFKIGQHHLALPNSPQKEAYEHLCGGLLFIYLGLKRSLENPISLHHFEDILGSTYIFRKLMMSSMP